ncbi:phosphoribosyl-AMP cyclohydrolase [Breznakia sp. PF5-3]|uniref:phosphoribosyl-AMP cyclohydrolase n=1 Tax=unclassified Breznakia TaxID=2623764 RepID=UPI00240623A8|nr:MULTISPECIES: phosphoribosyl-AMP cyclohydrolase [unclassified Breznakia]MDF9825644.1 phosphoribosyl-AMP cyclohydrolase [Breznakia sp. PM6-1]MDF9836482.1 phosphoribosyl-AMP cyclohydrolase [Breznakia sp. PF5-3]MDF9838673.1 phosphoribosyl-AMP cyclohydrolase [Breznakia sp. PFB2-8]MDF9860702.1 phosphoribosyl-AMP cyclohydrolase [Breznakia sp. PH5-24]
MIDKIDFDKNNGLIPVVVQEEKTNQVLMLAYMNKESLEKTLATKLATYYSRSRNELWIKGETSGHFQHVKEMYLDCDYDTILMVVKQDGVACHTGEKSCFFNELLGGNKDEK